MSKTYKLISNSTGREVEVAQFTYTESGRLTSFLWLKEPPEDKEIDYFTNAFPLHITTLQAIVGNVPTLKAVEFKFVPTFEEFWKVWEKKVKKLRAEKVWSKMTDVEKCMAYDNAHIPYRNANGDAQFMPNPDGWLIEKRWNEKLLTGKSKML